LFWDGSGDVRGGDTLAAYQIRDLPGLLKIYDAAVVVHVTGIESVKRDGPLPNKVYPEDPADQARLDAYAAAEADMPSLTTYEGEVQTWLKGSGEAKISIVAPGGLTSDGQAIFPDEMFLLEPGRTYLLLLDKNDTGAYEYGPAREAFDLTGGVHVLNHPDTRDLEYFESMSVEDFVSYVKQLATAGAAKTD
jgi:hypothetical protein